MYPLASQSSTASVHSTEAMSVAQAVTTAHEAIRASANDNSAAWTPSLLVQRRRRLSRRAGRS